jgi:indole-3-glycerol phosphate synthase
MPNKLDEICARKREEVAARKAATPLPTLRHQALGIPPPRGFANALRRRVARDEVALIAEIKRASPSAGPLRPDLSVREVAQAYEAGGAACLSILTDAPFFGGSSEDLTEAVLACSLPMLRKDFLVDPWQVVESRTLGADAVLLILAALHEDEAREIHEAARLYGMDVLIEIHTPAELDLALTFPPGLLGINNRDLKTLTTNLTTTEELAPLVPPGWLTVSESGVKGPEDIARLRHIGVNAFLVGESLLRQADVTLATRALVTHKI